MRCGCVYFFNLLKTSTVPLSMPREYQKVIQKSWYNRTHLKQYSAAYTAPRKYHSIEIFFWYSGSVRESENLFTNKLFNQNVSFIANPNVFIILYIHSLVYGPTVSAFKYIICCSKYSYFILIDDTSGKLRHLIHYIRW